APRKLTISRTQLRPRADEKEIGHRQYLTDSLSERQAVLDVRPRAVPISHKQASVRRMTENLGTRCVHSHPSVMLVAFHDERVPALGLSELRYGPTPQP